MTRQPPSPQAAYDARRRAALARNVLGLLLMVASTLGLGVLIWLESPLLFGALACCVGIGAGWVWATDEAE